MVKKLAIKNKWIQKHIVFTVSNDLSYDQRMQKICHSLSKAGYRVTLVGRKRAQSISLTKKVYGQVRLSMWIKKKWSGKLFYIELNIRLFLYLLFYPFDIVCAIDLDTMLPCYMVSVLKRKRRVYDAHELFTDLPELARRPITKKMWECMAMYAIPKFDKGYTVNESLVRIFNQRYGVQYISIANMAKRKAVDSSSIINAKYILYQGALNQGRGLEVLIRSMLHIDIPLYIAGQGDITSSLMDLVFRLRLTNRVHFLGELSPSELFEYTKNAWVGINLLDASSLNYYYSLANKFFDYVHAGIPSIHMNFPEYKRYNNMFEVAVLIDCLTTDACIAAIEKLVNSSEQYDQLKENCLIARKQWTWESQAVLLVDFYNSL